MSEVKKLWVVWDSNISAEEFFNDPAVKDEDDQVRQLIGEHDMMNILWQVQAMGAQKFEKGRVKFYADEASAKKDAQARIVKFKKKLKTADVLASRVARRFEALYGDLPKNILVWLGGKDQLRSKLRDVGPTPFAFLPHGVGIRFTKAPQPSGNYVEITMNQGNYDLTFFNNSIVPDEKHQTYKTVRDEVKTIQAVPGKDLAGIFARHTGIRLSVEKPG